MLCFTKRFHFMKKKTMNSCTIWKNNGNNPIIFISKNVSKFTNFLQKLIGVHECYVLSLKLTQSFQLLFCLSNAILQFIHERSGFCSEKILNVRFAFAVIDEYVAHLVEGIGQLNADRISFVLMKLLNRCPLENFKVILRMRKQIVKIWHFGHNQRCCFVVIAAVNLLWRFHGLNKRNEKNYNNFSALYIKTQQLNQFNLQI